MGSEGVPFLFDSFEVLGNAEMEKVLIQGWTVPAAIKPDKRLRDMPLKTKSSHSIKKRRSDISFRRAQRRAL